MTNNNRSLILFSLLVSSVSEMPMKASLLKATFFLALFLGATTWGHAQTTVYDFSSGNDTDWDRYNPLGLGTYTFSNGYYRIQSSAPGSATYGPGRAGSTITGLTVTDFKISVDLIDWDPALAQSVGIMARVSDIGAGTSNGYFFQFNPGSQNARNYDDITIDVLQDEAAIASSDRVRLSTNLDVNASYRMVFQGIGSEFTASIYALTDLDHSLATVTLTDATYASGYAGLLAADTTTSGPSGNPLGAADATFDNFSVAAIPEPSTYAYMILGVVGLGLAAIRRHRTHR